MKTVSAGGFSAYSTRVNCKTSQNESGMGDMDCDKGLYANSGENYGETVSKTWEAA